MIEANAGNDFEKSRHLNCGLHLSADALTQPANASSAGGMWKPCKLLSSGHTSLAQSCWFPSDLSVPTCRAGDIYFKGHYFFWKTETFQHTFNASLVLFL